MITIGLQMLGLLYAFVLPGTLTALHVDADWSWPVRLAVGFVVGLLTIPMAAFCAAWVLGTSVTPAVVVGAATVANGAAGGALWLRRRVAGRPYTGWPAAGRPGDARASAGRPSAGSASE